MTFLRLLCWSFSSSPSQSTSRNNEREWNKFLKPIREKKLCKWRIPESTSFFRKEAEEWGNLKRIFPFFYAWRRYRVQYRHWLDVIDSWNSLESWTTFRERQKFSCLSSACKSFTLKTFFELRGFTQRQKQYLFSSYSWYVLYIHEKFLVILNETFKGFSEATLCKVYEQTGNVDVLAYVRQLGTHKITEMKQQVLHWLKCENTV